MDIVSAVNEILDKEGVHAALRFLNDLTPHRFTGIYRYDGDILRNVYLYDQVDPSVIHGQDVAMIDAYCANVGRSGFGIEFSNINSNEMIGIKSGSPVISYCGVLVRDSSGKPYGTLCHYDLKSCDATGDLTLLEKIAPLVYRSLVRQGLPDQGGTISDKAINWQ